MTRRTIPHWQLAATAAAAFALHTATPALADEPTAKITLADDLTLEAPDAPSDEGEEKWRWLSSNVHLHKKNGLAYTRRLKLADRNLVFGIQGPVLRKQEALGLTFKIRF